MNQPAIAPLQAAVHSPDLERAVLGVLLDGRHSRLWSTFIDTCGSPLVFFMRDHRVIALTLSALFDAGAARVDAMTVIARLETMPWQQTWQALRAMESGHVPKAADGADLSESALVAIGGPNKVFDVMQALAPVGGFEANCKLLAAYKTQRDLVAVLTEANEAANAVDGQSRLGEIADKTISRIAALMMRQEHTGTISEAMRRAMVRVLSPGEVATPRPIALWGLTALDRALPLKPARYVVLAAQPGHGKSSLAFQAIVATAEALGPDAAALVNLEMPPDQIGAILLGRAIDAPTKAIENGHLGPEQAERARQVIEARAAADIALRTSHKRLTIDDLCAWIRQRHVRSAGRLALVVVDYLQLIDGKGRMSEYDRVSEASRSLKLLANQLGICLLVLSQLNREGTKADRDSRGNLKDNPEPRLADLRGSGSIEQDADAVVFIWPPRDGDSPNLDVWLKIGKNRGGPTTTRDHHIHAVFQRANGQTFRQVSAPASMSAPAETSRAHHNHPPRPDEDGWADRPMTEPA